ncbi:MAG: sigma-70 family RNA polymerase sigma factor [Eubacterium sp.]|nr:sigma-70 family RNA polymerase sigma factor [Eubacterium sp.]
MSENPDAKLVRELIEAHRQTMYSIALNILHNTHDAEDAVQNAFLWIINNLEKISSIPCNERIFYLANMTEHISINILNKKKKHPLEDIEIHEEINSDNSVEKAFFENITIEEIKQAIRTMSVTDRLILRLFLFEERSCKEIAEIAGISEENARVKVHRARKRLAKLLKERGIDYEY